MKIKTSRATFGKVILSVIGVVGIVALAAVAPNVVQLIAKLPGFKKGNGYNKKYHVNKTVEALVKKGLLEKFKREGNVLIRLTSAGEKEFSGAKLRDEIFQKQLSKWDGRWRLVIFDIKEEDKKLREKIRNELIQFGFERLQNSVWVTPHDCEDLIMLLKAEFSIGKDVLYVLADKIENDGWLKRKFGIED
ncbi:MAG: CRISPR-associated endonuclease Cas2 [Patescibacteria group bacterium]